MTTSIVSVSAQAGIAALGKAHTHSTPSLSSIRKAALETVPTLVWLNIERSRPWRVECRPLPFSTPLTLRRSMQWCVCPCSELSSSFGAPLPCQAADQMWYPLCLPVYLSVHSLGLWLAQYSRSTEVFVAEDCAWLCASRGSPFQTLPFAGGSLSLWECWHV